MGCMGVTQAHQKMAAGPIPCERHERSMRRCGAVDILEKDTDARKLGNNVSLVP